MPAMTSTRTAGGDSSSDSIWNSPFVRAYGDTSASSPSTTPPTIGRGAAGTQVGQSVEHADDDREHAPRSPPRAHRRARAQARSTPSIAIDDRKVPDRFQAEPAERRRHGVAAQRTDRRRHERLVVLEAAAMRDLEREDRRAERRAEQHAESGRHAGDRQRAHVVRFESVRVSPTRVASVPVVVTSGASGPSVPPVPTESSEIGISDRRRPSDPPPCRPVIGHPLHVDVADEQLDVGRATEHPDEHRDQHTDDGEHGDVGAVGPLPGPRTSVTSSSARRYAAPIAPPPRPTATIRATIRSRTPKNRTRCSSRQGGRHRCGRRGHHVDRSYNDLNGDHYSPAHVT